MFNKKFISGILVLLISFSVLTACGKKEEDIPPVEEEPKEIVDIIDVNSTTRPLAISINNTPVAVKVQEGLNKAYLIYEIPTEGYTSRLLALYKDVNDLTVGTIRSARHNFIDFSHESDAIFVSYGWSHYTEDELKGGAINYIQGINSEGYMWRDNKEHLATEHTVYLNTDKVYDYAKNKKGYSLKSDNTILLNYNVEDTDLSTMEGAVETRKVTLPYGNITTVFEYNEESKMYTRIVNGNVTVDHETKETFETKNIIVEKVNYSVMPDRYYWDLKVVGEGEGYYITNGYSVPIKWSKESRKSKTKYTYLDGNEISVSDGRTYIEVHITKKNATLE